MGATSDDWYLAIDLGTGGAKVAGVGGDGSIRVSAFASIDTTLTGDGGATQDTDTWWSGIVDATRALLDGDVEAGHCVGVGITGQWGSTVPVDASGAALGPCLLWSDDRGAELAGAVVGGTPNVSGYGVRKMLSWIRRAGGAPSTSGADPTGHALYLRAHEPDLYAATHALLEPVDFLGTRLTGRIAATPASMVLSWLTDNRAGAKVEYDPVLVQLADRDAAKLPELARTGSVLGPMTAGPAGELGLPPGIPVVAGVPDLHTAYLGSGALSDYEGHVSISTTAWVSAAVPFKKTDVLRQMASIPGVRRGSYLIANNHETGGATLRWFRDAMCSPPPGDTTSATPSYDEIVAWAGSVPAGAGGVIFAPWLKGERSPVDDRDLRGSFVNLSLSSDRTALARAVLEGVAYNAAWLLEATEKFAGRQLHGLRILGGGAQSALWCQIHADVIGRPIGQVADPMHVNVRGAAWFAALALRHMTMRDVAERAPAASTFQPDPAATAAYRPLYTEFTQLYAEQKDMYRRLNGRRRS